MKKKTIIGCLNNEKSVIVQKQLFLRESVLLRLKGSETSVYRSNIFFVLYLTEWEGQVFGVGCKIFTIAGPVILYGIFTSWVLGVIYWIAKLLGVI